MQSIFHLAYYINDLASARVFYGEVLGCSEGRSTDTWVDYDFFGHQISLHLGAPFATDNGGLVAGKAVPMPHLGIILLLADWTALRGRLERADVPFILPPQVRYAGKAGEQHTMFFADPAGNPIEAKGVKSFDSVFAC